MTWLGRSLIISLMLIVAMVALISNVSANDWNVASGGVSEDEFSSIGTFAGTGTGTIPASTSISITVGTGQDFFTSGDVIAPKIAIYAPKNSIAQVAVVLGSISPLTVYHDPDSLLSPWLLYPVNINISGSKNFQLFSFDADVIAGLIEGDEVMEPFGIFVRILDNYGTVLDEASFSSYIINILVNPVQAPSW